MDSKKLEILMTAVNLGSFSKASEVVGYTQSGLTHLINGLEREIGMTLIRRDHSGIALTEDGEALLPAIREYLSATARLENQIEAITKKRTATIRCWRRGAPTSSLPHGRAASTAIGRRCITTRCMPSCRRIIRSAGERAFPSRNSTGRSS